MEYNQNMTTREAQMERVKPAAAECGVSPMTLKRRLRDGRLRGVRVGPKLWLIPRTEIEAFKAGLRQ